MSDRSLPPYPPLPGSTEHAKIDEIRRTIYVSNLDPRVTFENVHDLFCQVGEIAFIRMTKSEQGIEYENLGLTSNIKEEENIDLYDDSIGAYIEFSEQPSVVKALCLNGLLFAKRHIRVNHANSAILIPPSSNEQVNLDDLRKESAKMAAKKHSSSKDRHHHRHHSDKHHNNHKKRHTKGGSASESSSQSESSETDEDEDEEESDEQNEEDDESENDSDESEPESPPRKQRRSSRSRSG